MNHHHPIQPSPVAPATLLLPAADLFGRRAARLRQLAPLHAIGDWLNWLAELSAAQQQALDILAVPAIDLGAYDPSRPPLSATHPLLDQAWQAVYVQLRTAATSFTPSTLLPIETPTWLREKATRCLEHAAGGLPTGTHDVGGLLVAAALQVTWSAAARQLALPQVLALGHQTYCPCCGSTALGSIVMAGDGKAGLRYLECSLCATRWNAVRARCTLCDDGLVVSYLGLEDHHPAVQAESCDACQGYTKTYFQNKDHHVDPTADDLATLALDVLVGEQGYGRGLPNLFLHDGSAV
jgi:FdhE protein